MANDWIKMRMDLVTHPKVMRMVALTGSDKLRVIGALHCVWSLFDTHSESGHMQGYDFESIDQYIGFVGFADAMAKVGWLHQLDSGLEVPDFSEHNGKSAKHRAHDAKRKRASRACAASNSEPRTGSSHADLTDMGGSLTGNVLNLSIVDADELRTREEKRRGDKQTASSVTECPVQEIVDLYHENCPDMPRVKILNEKRRKQIRARWREDSERQNLEWWRSFFLYCSQSSFLTGSSGFNCSLEWLTKSSNIVKVIEGHYENKEAAREIK